MNANRSRVVVQENNQQLVMTDLTGEWKVIKDVRISGTLHYEINNQPDENGLPFYFRLKEMLLASGEDLLIVEAVVDLLSVVLRANIKRGITGPTKTHLTMTPIMSTEFAITATIVGTQQMIPTTSPDHSTPTNKKLPTNDMFLHHNYDYEPSILMTGHHLGTQSLPIFRTVKECQDPNIVREINHLHDYSNYCIKNRWGKCTYPYTRSEQKTRW